jgi:pyridoxal phosphate enzyme (YggS family)
VTEITDHLADIRGRVARALDRAGRDHDDVMIVAVSKQQSQERIAAAYRAGQIHFGESYVQEALPKMDALRDLPIVWHYIGPVQANKTRPIAERFQWVHSVDRAKIAERLSAQRPFHAPPLNVLVQINLAAEPQKAGVRSDEVAELARVIGTHPKLVLRGLMGIPPAQASREETTRFFAGLRELKLELAGSGIVTDTLSMGMSGDFETAILCGSTCVRIGTAIFGPRATPKV